MLKEICWTLSGLLLFATTTLVNAATDDETSKDNTKYIIIYVWDGLRPDSVTAKNTPTLYALMKRGVEFQDHHASYPTLTMMNSASFATGDLSGKTGFFGNVLWDPHAKGFNANGESVSFQQPVYTEDYKVLQDLNENKLILVDTLFQLAHKNNIKTAVVGKTGAAFFQDYLSTGIILDEKHVYPLSFAKELQNANYPLPKLSLLAYKPDELTLSKDNGDPTAQEKLYYFADGVTTNPLDSHGSPYTKANEYMMNIYLEKILPQKPQLSLIWMRDPDSTEHRYGPGTPNYKVALMANDQMLNNLLEKLKSLNILSNTDILIVSDHAHSTIAAPSDEFPLRKTGKTRYSSISAIGSSVSGEIRTADLLTKAGFHAYDGQGCRYNPIMSGIKIDGESLYPTLTDATGKTCGKEGIKYTTPAYKVPAELPNDAIIIAPNGGSVYFYIPSHDPLLIQKLVTFLQSHEQFDTIFINNSQYGKIAGTFPMSAIKIENASGRSPDLIVGLNFDSKAKVNGLPGIEFSDSTNSRGMHGSFSPIDVHNFLIAVGPDFRANTKDTLPTANVDVAPTIAYLLGLDLKNTDGRILEEALVNNADKKYGVKIITIPVEADVTNLTIFNALNKQTTQNNYKAFIRGKVLTDGKNSYTYFDSAEAVRW